MEPLTLTSGTQAIVNIREGYIPDAANSSAIIVSGPSNVNVKGINGGPGRWIWNNMLPGDYVVGITSCGITQNLPLEVKGKGLEQSITSEGKSICSGGGSIVSTVKYTGAYQNTVELLNSSGDVIATNPSGNFNNLEAGTYSTRLKITINKCQVPKYLNKTYYIPGSTITLTGNSTGPEVSGVAMVCEVSENSINNGVAYLNIQGVPPYTIRYKEVSSSDWTNISNVMDPNYSITNLTPNATYNIEIVDSCGKSHSNQYTVNTIPDLLTAPAQHPCEGSPYTLKGQYFAGATYKWINPSGAVVSTEKDYHIPSYNKSMNGTYTLETRWEDCVIRYTKISIYGNFCNMPINQNNISGKVFLDNTKDNVVNGTGIGILDETQLYVSLEVADQSGNGNQNIITTVKVNADGTYTIPSIPEGNYNIILGINPLGSTSSSLPFGWHHTGESIANPTDGNIGELDGVIFITQQSHQGVDNVNFGINREFCYKPANTAGTSLPTKFGITALGRAGSDNDNKTWPTAMKGAHMILESKTKGLVINRVNNPTTDIGSPVEGMMVYNITEDCLSIYNGTSWKCLRTQSCPD